MKIYFKIILCCLPYFLRAQAPSHNLWDDLLKKYVDSQGNVDYKAWTKDSFQLNNYLMLLSSHPPAKTWNREETFAYWINAYNAFTVQLILRNYPIKSIKDIGGKIPFVNSTWDIKFIHIGKEQLDLNTIEHLILRKQFKDPRIHMVLVCAARSCPSLYNQAFVSTELNTQLDRQAREFIQNPMVNHLKSIPLKLSPIFKWYASDFKASGGVLKFINRYSDLPIRKDRPIEYLEYDWSLNEKLTGH